MEMTKGRWAGKASKQQQQKKGIYDWLNCDQTYSISPALPPWVGPSTEASPLWDRGPQKGGGIKDEPLWVEAMVVVVVHLLPAITSSILSSIIDVKRIITLAGSPFATSDITVNPLMDPNTLPMQNRPQTFVSAFNTNLRLHADLKPGPWVHIQETEKKKCSADISSCSILCTD